MRGDLARILYDATKAGTEYIFGDSIAELTELGDGVEVRFESGMRRSFDLVIGADGLHSNVRGLAFGPEKQFVRDLGLYASIFTVTNRQNLDYSGRLFSAPGTIAGVYSARQNREARALMFFDGDFGDYDYRDVGAQKQFVRQRFAGQGWHVPQILADMELAPDFYFDTISQVVIERWSRGRVALLGDAAHCASPLSGMGTGMAVVGAYILAEELNASRNDHEAAFLSYQRKLQPFVDASQTLAHKAVGGFVPKGNFGIGMRNLMMKLLPLLPVEVMLKETYAAANAISI